MTQPRRRRRTGSDLGSAAPRRTYPVKGAVRRAQMITTYGVGGLIAVDNESFIISGLDNADRSWSRHEAQSITEPRLANLLGVSHFRLPPASGDESEDGVRVKRFPWWQSCSKCELLAPYKDFGSPSDKSVCPTCSDNPLVPSRFVMACEHGHIEDFPYWKWLHRKERGEGASGGKCGGVMRLRSTGTTTSLRSVILSCSCGVSDMSMEGSFRQRALSDLGIACSGRRPWLDAAPAEHCTQPPHAPARFLRRLAAGAALGAVHPAVQQGRRADADRPRQPRRPRGVHGPRRPAPGRADAVEANGLRPAHRHATARGRRPRPGLDLGGALPPDPPR